MFWDLWSFVLQIELVLLHMIIPHVNTEYPSDINHSQNISCNISMNLMQYTWDFQSVTNMSLCTLLVTFADGIAIWNHLKHKFCIAEDRYFYSVWETSHQKASWQFLHKYRYSIDKTFLGPCELEKKYMTSNAVTYLLRKFCPWSFLLKKYITFLTYEVMTFLRTRLGSSWSFIVRYLNCT